MMTRKLAVICLGALAMALTACATSPIPKSVRQRVTSQPSFEALRAKPDAYKGMTLILGGTIVSTRNLPDFAEIEVVQKPLGSQDRPLDTDNSAGRFIIHCRRYLDPAVYEKGREVTVAGQFEGIETRPLDQISYAYPMFGCESLYLWSAQTYPAYYYNYPPYYYYPWPGYYPYSPWWWY